MTTALQHVGQKMEKVRGWLDYLDEMYDVLLSRKSETASTSGWDDRPRLRPCEHRLEWKRGQLCLACDNTGLRPLASGEEGIDPYALGASAIRGGFTASTNLDETEAQRRSARSQKLTSALEALERQSAVRDGIEAEEDAILVKLRKVSRKPRSLRRVERALAVMRETEPDDYALVGRPEETRALLRLTLLVRGQLDPPPPHVPAGVAG